MPHQADPLADVKFPHIGPATRIWQFVVILPNARKGTACNICSHVLIENDVTIGDRVTVKPSVQLWDGLRIEDDVFIGPNVTFTNELFPRSKQYPATFPVTTVRTDASIGRRRNPPAGHNGRSKRQGGRDCCNHPVGALWRRGGGQPSAHRALRGVGR